MALNAVLPAKEIAGQEQEVTLPLLCLATPAPSRYNEGSRGVDDAGCSQGSGRKGSGLERNHRKQGDLFCGLYKWEGSPEEGVRRVRIFFILLLTK